MPTKTTRPIVTLTTDFGVSSPYVAQMKGVLLSRNPDIEIVDITHEIPPQDIQTGAIVLADTCLRFPPRTIHIAVVDPGVGSNRRIVFAKIAQHRFIAPDNGLLSGLATRHKPENLIAITNRIYFLPEVSATFHGRDIMAPVAAHLSLGLQPSRLGERIDSIVMLPASEPKVESRRITGSVIHIDSFGNVITNITAEHVAGVNTEQARVACRGFTAEALVRTYSDKPAGTLVALIGSSGRLELAIVGGNAAERLGAQPGDDVVVSW